MMNVSTVPQQTGTELADVYHQRLDEQICAVVDRGILVQNSFNTICAIEYLKSHNVNPEVIERVLLHPELRRKITH
jgi:hypothetical protein